MPYLSGKVLATKMQCGKAVKRHGGTYVRFTMTDNRMNEGIWIVLHDRHLWMFRVILTLCGTVS